MPTKKTIPKKWVFPVSVAVLAGGYYIYKKKQKSSQQKATEVNPYLAQSFIPVTAENVAGVGALSRATNPEEATALLATQEENFQAILGFIENRERNKNEFALEKSTRQGEKEANRFSYDLALKELTNNLTGGGSPSGETNDGTVTATTSPGQLSGGSSNVPIPIVESSHPQPVSAGCPPTFPLYNPAPGRGCYRISTTTTKGGCICHGYPSGQLECQQGKISNGSCHW